MGDRTDFFISHAGSDRAWAEWVAWQLLDAGYRIELDVWDWPIGANLVTAMSDALSRCEFIVALYSTAYFDPSRYTTDEWTVAVLRQVESAESRIVPLRINDVPFDQIPPMLKTRLAPEICGLPAEQARRVVVDAAESRLPRTVDRERSVGPGPGAGSRRPRDEPPFPGGSLSRRGVGVAVGGQSESERRPAGSLPKVWNIPARNRAFVGREQLLEMVAERLVAGGRTSVQVLHGLGGVGKTQLAIEYAYRFARSYDLAWWIEAEQVATIAEQFAALGVESGWVDSTASAQSARSAVLRELRQRSNWLLIFDNAPKPESLARWLPGGNGHVLITSRPADWTQLAWPVEVDVLARPESVSILRNGVSEIDESDADELAEKLGDLPLALTQATGFMSETGAAAMEYGRLLASQAERMMRHSTPFNYPRSLAAATVLNADQLAQDDPPAAELANLCAFLSPEPIPDDLFMSAPGELTPQLRARLLDQVDALTTRAAIMRHSLARIDGGRLRFHRLTQAILRDRLSEDEAAKIKAHIETILAASVPDAPDDPSIWPRWAQLVPHLLAANLATSDNPALRATASATSGYLSARGDLEAARKLDEDILRRRRDTLGLDHRDTLAAARSLAATLAQLRNWAQASGLARDTLDRQRRTLGEDHQETLSSAGNLAGILSLLDEHQAARELAEDTLARGRRSLGDSHPSTLASASNLAYILARQGEVEAARKLNERTLDALRRTRGLDHPDTLNTADNLARDLHRLGELAAARELAADTLRRRREVLGEAHPDTAESARHLNQIDDDLSDSG